MVIYLNISKHMYL